MGVPREERDKGAERVFREIIAENFTNLMKDISINIQEAQQTPGKMNSKGSTLKHIIIKLSKARAKEGNLKAVKEKRIITYMGFSVR